MHTSAALRIQIEHALGPRFPGALTPAPRGMGETASTGIAQLDSMLEDGLPVGGISELVGPVSSGRTSLAIAFVSARTAAEQACAWVDTNDAFDPESAAANGVVLSRLLWVRCRRVPAQGAQNRTATYGSKRSSQATPWTALDQALRATDLLLQAGGFAAIVLDLGDVSPQCGSRIPLATWFRFRQAADRTRCSLVVPGYAAYAQSSAALMLECRPVRVQTAGGKALKGLTFQAQHQRQRFVPIGSMPRKQAVSTWSASAPWDAEQRA